MRKDCPLAEKVFIDQVFTPAAELLLSELKRELM